ncbi:flagellar motor switch protein FliM [Acetanaerobacterium elongatum]|uniref:Flagellar motor switch protein FliM n=1 Tax=Acetanaerobacterium elongatum TaxID=258515 RepID=A0A1G9ZG57_9FIRM|nr:flagellar motor switch protein FliM [Acetanaerobacterium elongatum]SDN19981.1 flagellar motor switch protein FliM [Acetanaerobacterium elongatum]
MPDILSQAQIDELLKGLNTGTLDLDEIDEKASEKKVKEYDFRSPKKFTKEQLKKLDSIYSNYTRSLSSYFTGILRMFCQLDVSQIEEQRYHEYSNALPDSVLMGVVDLNIKDSSVADGTIIFELSRPMVFSIIDRLLGGSGDIVNIERDFTEIELSLVENVLKNMVKLFKDAWKSYTDMDPQLVGIETNSRLMQTISLDDIVLITVIDVTMRGQVGNLSVCIPAINLEEIIKKMNARSQKSDKKLDEFKENERRDIIFSSVKDSDLELTAVLGEVELTLSDVLNLQVDDIVQLDKSINDVIDIRVGTKTWLRGKMGNYKKKKAVQITEIL